MGGNHSKNLLFPHSKSPPWTDPNTRHKIARPDASAGPGVLCQWCGTVAIFSERESTLYLCKHCTASFTDENLRPPPPPHPHAYPHPVCLSSPVPPYPARQPRRTVSSDFPVLPPIPRFPRLSIHFYPSSIPTDSSTPYPSPPLSRPPLTSPPPPPPPPSSFAPSTLPARASFWDTSKRVRRRSRRGDTKKTTVTYNPEG